MDELRPFLRRVVFLAEGGVQELLVKGLAGGYHRENVLLGRDNALEQHGLVVGVLEELLHLGREVLCFLTSDSVYAHGLSELDEVRVHHASVGVSLIVEEIYTRKVRSWSDVSRYDTAYLAIVAPFLGTHCS